MVPEQMALTVREYAAAPAIREQQNGSWVHLNWAEVEDLVARVAGPLMAGAATWDAETGVGRFLVGLAALHVGRRPGEAVTVSAAELARWCSRRAEPGLLVRLRKELRPRDPAIEFGRSWTQADVGAAGERLAQVIGARSPDGVLVSAGTAAELQVGWAAVYGGFCLIPGPVSLLPTVAPTVWVALPEQVAQLGLPASRLGPLGSFARRYSRTDAALGPRLRRVVVMGSLPAEAEALRSRGLQVEAWLAGV